MPKHYKDCNLKKKEVSYSTLFDQITRKLLIDLKDNKISHNDFLIMSRSLHSIEAYGLSIELI